MNIRLFCLTVATVFLYEWSLFGSSGIHLSLTKILGVVAALSVSFTLLHKGAKINARRARAPTRSVVIVCLVLAFDVLGMAVAIGRSNAAADFAIQQTGAMIWLLLPLILIRSSRDLNRVMVAYAIAVTGIHAGILLSGFGVVSVGFGNQGDQRVLLVPGLHGARRSAGFLNNFGEIAIATAFALPWMVSSIRSRNWGRLHKGAVAGALTVVATGSIVSLSRNVWLASMVSLLMLITGGVFLGVRGHARVLLIILGAICAVGLSALIWEVAQEAITFASSLREESIGSRINQYEATLDKIGESPVFGWGPGVYIEGLPVHNFILNAVLTAGIGGWFLVIALTLVLVWVVGRALQSIRQQPLAIAAGFSGVLVACMFYPVIGNSAPIFWMTFGIAASSVTNKLDRASADPQSRWPPCQLDRNSSSAIGTERLVDNSFRNI